MPFLVDSLGMAFGRADLAVHLIVHPVLQVRRDRRGQLIDIGANGAHAAHPESWQLYEIDRVTDPEQLRRLQHDLESTLGDVRAAVTDWRGDARAGARDHHAPGERPAAAAARRGERGGATCSTGWRRATSCSSATATTACERGRIRGPPGAGHAARGSASCARRAASGRRPRVTLLRGDVRARAREPEPLVVTKANSSATVHRAGAARLRRSQDLRQPRARRRRASFPRALDLDRLPRQPARYSGAAPQGRARHRALRPRSRQPRWQGGAERARNVPARRAVPGRRARPDPHRARGGQPV